MKVLYLSNYRSGTGYGQAAIDYILSLDAVGVDVVPRNLDIAGNSARIPDRLEQLEGKSSFGVDITIQHTLPEYMHYTPRCKNIGLFAYETDNFVNSGWNRHLNMMDEVWVINQQMVEACGSSDVNTRIAVIPHAVDTSKFDKDIKPFELPINDYIFYFIGEANIRKGLEILLRAFHSEFSRDEGVSLLIKTGGSNDSVAEFCNNVKRGLKKYDSLEKYINEYILCDYLAEEQLYAIHKRCDCFVAASYGEAWCIPAMDALGFGNVVLGGKHTGFADYLPPDMKVGCNEVPVYGYLNTLKNLYTADENWWEVSVNDLRSKMRAAFEGRIKPAREVPSNYSYEKIGNLMKERLERLCQK